MSNKRNRLLENFLEIFEIMLDGNSHTIKSFRHLNVSDKTIKRYLISLERMPKYKVNRLITSDDSRKFTRWICKFNTKEHKEVKIKECYKCGIVSHKPKEDFYKNGRMYDGLEDICKMCRKNYNKESAKVRKKLGINRKRRQNQIRRNGEIKVT